MTNALLLYNRLIPSVRLCAYSQLNYLSELGKINFQHCEVRKITTSQIKDNDVVIMVRSDSYLEEALAKIFKNAGKYLVYILDDDLLNIPEGLSSSKHYRSAEVKTRITSIMAICDCLLSPSKKILEKYGDSFRKVGLIEEPALGYKALIQKSNSHPIKIGFAGSTDRSADIDQILADTIKAISEKYKDKVQIEFFGAKPDLIKDLGLNYFPYEDSYEDYQNKMWELNWDIGLAPMPDTEFHRFKHYNKYIEYCAQGIIGIYSNVYPYVEVIKNGENGFLCNNSKNDWVEKISYCIDNSDKLDRVRKQIKIEAEGIFSVKQVSEIFIKAVPELLDYKSSTIVPDSIWYKLFCLKLFYIFIRIVNLLRKTLKYISDKIVGRC